MWLNWKNLNFGGHLGFWKPSWNFLKLSYFSHFESYWRQILNFKPKMWQHWQILVAILNFLEIAIFQSWRKESAFTFFYFWPFWLSNVRLPQLQRVTLRILKPLSTSVRGCQHREGVKLDRDVAAQRRNRLWVLSGGGVRMDEKGHD